MQATFYFRPLHQEIKLSYLFNITLRNPRPDEMPVLEQSLKNLSARLSDKERRRILYTLHPLGGFSADGSLEEQFVRELAKIWVLIDTDKQLPFEKGLTDYGYLCGFTVDSQYQRNPSGFVCDHYTLSPRELLRALKLELPKAAKLTPDLADIKDIERQASRMDGVMAQNHTAYRTLAEQLRLAGESVSPLQKLIHYCAAGEILLVNNKKEQPVIRQFSSKMALVRMFYIKLQNQHDLHPPEDMARIFGEIYQLRSDAVHGMERRNSQNTAQYLNVLFPTIRTAIRLKNNEPVLMNFIKGM